jgi:hypothetical protein
MIWDNSTWSGKPCNPSRGQQTVLALNRMSRDIFPDLGVPVLYVAQPYGGMDPAQMEGFTVNYYEYLNAIGVQLAELDFAKAPNCAGHLLAIIKPKIVRHTIILSTDNLFLLTPPTSPSGRVANPAVINLSIRSFRSLPSAFRVIFFFGVEHVRCIFL